MRQVPAGLPDPARPIPESATMTARATAREIKRRLYAGQIFAARGDRGTAIGVPTVKKLNQEIKPHDRRLPKAVLQGVIRNEC